jgi:DNA-binding XRE family transcriptional regulator
MLRIVSRRAKADEVPVFSRLEDVRIEHGMTRQELADAVSVHYQTIGYLERGEYHPSLALALQLAQVLQVPLEELFSLAPFRNRLPEATSKG